MDGPEQPPEDGNGNDNGHDPAPDPTPPTLDAAVRRRRADPAFFQRVRAAIEQNRRALERLGR